MQVSFIHTTTTLHKNILIFSDKNSKIYCLTDGLTNRETMNGTETYDSIQIPLENINKDNRRKCKVRNEWKHKCLFFRPWNAEPNNAGGDEDCAIMYEGGRYNDFPCSAKAFYICEKPVGTCFLHFINDTCMYMKNKWLPSFSHIGVHYIAHVSRIFMRIKSNLIPISKYIHRFLYPELYMKTPYQMLLTAGSFPATEHQRIILMILVGTKV